jgi:pimeloyl-ACP methyl ester carboxylesterase
MDKIGVLGLSMGGAVASMLAGICRDDVSSLCLWAPAGNMGELVIRGYSEEEINAFRKSGGYMDVGGLLLGSGFIEDVMNLDIYARAEDFDKNVLILHGDKDQSVPVSTSEKYLEIYETRGVLHIIEGSDHTFNKKEWEEEVLEYTLGFFEEELK